MLDVIPLIPPSESLFKARILDIFLFSLAHLKLLMSLNCAAVINMLYVLVGRWQEKQRMHEFAWSNKKCLTAENDNLSVFQIIAIKINGQLQIECHDFINRH